MAVRLGQREASWTAVVLYRFSPKANLRPLIPICVNFIPLTSLFNFNLPSCGFCAS